MSEADVTICIPTWQAEAFIERTLDCARAQTYGGARILVAIDKSTDGTEEICRAAAKEDPRIEIIAHQERLGWARNVNSLYDRVGTEYFCTYFHDDLIDPRYVEKLLARLHGSPDAACAYCDMNRTGEIAYPTEAINYPGPVFQRIMDFFTRDAKGVILRGMIRSHVLDDGLRFPHTDVIGRWQPPPFIIKLLAAGPCLRVPETLYTKWNRAERMTKNWGASKIEDLVAGQSLCARLCLDVIDRTDAQDQEKRIMRYCLALWLMNHTYGMGRTLPGADEITPETLSPAFSIIYDPPDLSRLDEETQGRIAKMRARFLKTQETSHSRPDK